MVETIQERSTYEISSFRKMNIIKMLPNSDAYQKKCVKNRWLSEKFDQIGMHTRKMRTNTYEFQICLPCSWRPLSGRASQSCWTLQHHQSSEDRTSWLKDSIWVTYERLTKCDNLFCGNVLICRYVGLFMSKHFATTGKVCCYIYTLLLRDGPWNNTEKFFIHISPSKNLRIFF